MPRASRTTGGGSQPVIVEAALNGGRERREHPRVPYSPAETVTDALACAAAGATVVHLHARNRLGAWSASPAWYGDTIRRIRREAPNLLISITSLRPASVPADIIVNLLAALAGNPETTPDLISVNLGHITLWEPMNQPEHQATFAGGGGGGPYRRTVHYPNGYGDIVAILRACRAHRIAPELGVMDLGFISNAVTLRNDGVLPDHPWCLLELDSPAYGAGAQVTPSTVEDYDLLAARLSRYLPGARWAAHGHGQPGFEVIRRALMTGAHVRVGLEDSVVGPDGKRAESNAALVAWAVQEARAAGRRLATSAEARAIIGLAPGTQTSRKR